MTRLLIDTDIGGDIDDAIALVMALNEPALDVVGVTNVYMGNAWRGEVTRELLTAYGRPEIPVVFGAERPLLGSWGQEETGANEAVDFIIHQARKEPLTVLAIGPLTNLGLALAKAPDIAGNLHIYAMGGMLNRAHPEWNIQCDPEAAQLVLSSGAAVTLAALDVTEQCRLDEAQARALVAGEGQGIACLRKNMERFLTSFNFLPTLHDPLALLCLLEPELCTYEDKEICVETQGQWTRGVTVDRRWPQHPNVHAAVTVDASAVVEAVYRRVRARL